MWSTKTQLIMELNKEMKNYFKLQSLIKIATDGLRLTFMKKWEQMNESVNTLKNVKQYMESCKVKKLQKTCIESGDIKKWDLSLLVMALKSINGLDINQINNIQTLTTIRNKCAHNPNSSYTDEEFNQFWSKAVPVLVSFGESKEELELLKNQEIIFRDKPLINGSNDEKAKDSIRLAEEHLEKGRFKEAIDLCITALALNDVSDQYISELLSKCSFAYLSLQESEQGISYFSISCPIDDKDLRYKALMDAKQLYELNPIWWRSHYRIGCAYNALNKLSKAIVYLERAFTLEPNEEEIKTAIALTRHKLSEESRNANLGQRYVSQTSEDSLEKYKKSGVYLRPQFFTEMEEFYDKRNHPFVDVIRGDKYRDGRHGVKQNYEMAAKYYGKVVANEGNAEGFWNLSILTKDGKGVKQNLSFAIKLLENAAKMSPKHKNTEIIDKAVVESNNLLGLHYQEKKNRSLAEKWFLKASENGSPNGALNLGLMYLNGRGVERNFMKAKQYLTLAVNRKDNNAMESLAYYYLNTGDIENAKLWYSRAINNGSIHAIHKEKEFYKQLSLTPNAVNIDSSETELLIEFLNISTEAINLEILSEMTKYSKFDLKAIIKYAKNNSIIAKRMETALKYFYKAVIALEEIQLNPQNSSLKTQFIANFADCIRTEPLVSTLPQKSMTKAIEVIQSVINSKENTNSQLDMDSRVCFAQLNINSINETILFLKECNEKYSKEIFFYTLIADLYGFQRNFSEGLKVLKKALKLSPNNCDLMYSKAVIMGLDSDCETRDKINAYLDFLVIAPKDHRFVPDSYYAITILEFEFHSKNKNKCEELTDNTISLIKSYFEKGLSAQSNELPFFMPYESNNKLIAQLIIRMIGIMFENTTPETTVTQDIPPNNAIKPIECEVKSDKLSDPYRIEVITSFRELFTKSQSELKNTIKASPLLQQKYPKSLAGLKPLTLKDMDQTRDDVYEGYAMEITFIEEPLIVNNSIISIIRDENNEIQRFVLYNCNDMSKAKQSYTIGCKADLFNPCLELIDGKPSIRIDNPKSVFIFDKC